MGVAHNEQASSIVGEARPSLRKPLIAKGDAEPAPEQRGPPRLSWGVKLAYGLGTIMTDMTAAAWFSYLLLYLPEAGLSPDGAGLVALAGQVADALFTPLAGHLSDNTRTRFGRRKPWLLGGSILIGLSFTLVFSECFLCNINGWGPTWLPVAYFSVWASVFNFGWASVCVSHMSLVPELTPYQDERVLLNSVRFFFTGLSQLFVFLIALGWFKATDNIHDQYRYMAFTILGCGTLSMIVCLLFVPEKSSVKEKDDKEDDIPAACEEGSAMQSSTVEPAKKSSALAWFKSMKFYQVGMVYMFTRLVVVLGQTSLAFYVECVQQMPAEAKATAPLVVNIASIPTTLVLKRIGDLLGLRMGFTLAGSLCVAAFTAMYFIPVVHTTAWLTVVVYAVMCVVGAGTAGVAVFAMSMEAEVVGNDNSSGAFVYGVYGFLEKLSGGVVIFALEHFSWINRRPEDESTRISTTIVVAACAAIAILFALTCKFHRGRQSGDKCYLVEDDCGDYRPPGEEGENAGLYVAQISWASTTASSTQ